VFKAYDVRGRYPDPLDEKIAWKIGAGAAVYLTADAAAAGETTPMMRNIVVGRDMRKSSPSMAKALAKGITDFGANVIDVGLVDTPFVYFAVNKLDCAGGVQTTASHNPPEYNGFKVSKRRARPVGENSGLAEIRKQAAIADPDKVPADINSGRVEQRDLWDSYIEHVRRFLDTGGKKIKVVVDASNGMAGTMVPRVFGKKGADIPGLEIIELYFDNSKGEFVHPPDPLVRANLRDLQQKVRDTGADLGLCFDGDADRCMVVDERGEPVGCDHLTAWLARWFLARDPGSHIVYDLRSSKAVEEDIIAAGGKPIRSRVGHVFMKAALYEHKAVFGGELSGHFYFRDNFFTDSGAIAMATVLSALAEFNKPMSKAIAPIARYAQSGEINFEVEDKDAALEDLIIRYEDDGEIDTLDGVTVDCFEKHGWWCNVRKSNTEPLLRLNLEARDAELMNSMVAEIEPLLGVRADGH
ncbi:MAG: phosphomannomutase/phosphoglucomutase, partial [Planctomycetota bacterium]|nr:phosphomannomutase/phosphoglucomutase [Planctomycetota bacterium]